MPSNMSLKATVFIPTYNGDAYLDEILSILFKQVVDFDYEVLIIDSGSTDGTINIIRKYLAKHENMRFVEIEKKDFGHGKTRNYAAEIAKGEFIVYLSHDAIPASKRWLYEMLAPFAISEKVVGVTGRQIPRHKCVPLLKYEIRSVFGHLGPESATSIFYKDTFMKNPIYKDVVTFYSDVNSATRRKFLLEVVPYRDVPYAEDQLFGRDIIEAGYYKAYAPRASVIHSNDISLREYKHRTFDEVVGLRRIGTQLHKPSIKSVIKMVVVGSLKDAVRTVYDKQYSIKRKLFWIFLNPFYHIEKWRGFRMAISLDLKDDQLFNKNSLEARRHRQNWKP